MPTCRSKKRTHCGDRPKKTKALLPAVGVFSEQPNRSRSEITKQSQSSATERGVEGAAPPQTATPTPCRPAGQKTNPGRQCHPAKQNLRERRLPAVLIPEDENANFRSAARLLEKTNPLWRPGQRKQRRCFPQSEQFSEEPKPTTRFCKTKPTAQR